MIRRPPRSTRTDTLFPYTTLFRALAAGATIPCADYLGFGDLTPEVLDYILFTSRDRGGNELATVTADLNGDLFRLPAGPVSFAAGLVYRTEKGWRDPDPLTVLRSEERGVGNEGVSTCRSRWRP